MNKFLKVLKWILFVTMIVMAAGLIYHYVAGLVDSLYNPDDIKTAQTRLQSGYEYLAMDACGLVIIGCLVGYFKIKVEIIPEKIKNLFKKNNDSQKETK